MNMHKFIQFTMDENKIISAFAFKTGKLIEELIKEQTDNLREQNQMLEAKILQWYAKSKDTDFAEILVLQKAFWKCHITIIRYTQALIIN